MKNKFDIFLELHHQGEPLLIGNVWNVQSARLFEEKGYKAIATSSAAIAETLGYPDGEQMPFDEYMLVIKRIAKCTKIPFSVDLEAGYGSSPEDIVRNIANLAKLDVTGINIEDSVVNHGERTLIDATAFQSKLVEICRLLKDEPIRIFINVRIDTFLLRLNEPMVETRRRIRLYSDTGVHGIFLPCIENEKDIKESVAVSPLPLNVMCMPDLPDFQTLNRLGVKRISSGSFLNMATYSKLNDHLDTIKQHGSFNHLFHKQKHS